MFQGKGNEKKTRSSMLGTGSNHLLSCMVHRVLINMKHEYGQEMDSFPGKGKLLADPAEPRLHRTCCTLLQCKGMDTDKVNSEERCGATMAEKLYGKIRWVC